MATTLQIKRTSTPNLPTGGINSGELVYIYDTSAAGSDVGEHGQRLYIGNYSGSTFAPIAVGGEYFTNMLDHGHGTLTADSALIVDQFKKINEFYVDNLAFDNATISTATSSNANLTLQPDGTGKTVIYGLQVDVSGTPTNIDEYVESITNAQLVTNASHTGVTVAYNAGGNGELDISLVDLLSITGTASVGSSTAIPVITYDTYGRITGVTTASISTALTITDPDGTTNGSITLGTDDLEFEEGQGVAVAVSGTGASLQVSITGTLATSSAVGVAKFNTSDFAVDGNGDVTIKIGGVTNDQLAGSIANAKLVNSKIVIGQTDVNLGDTIVNITNLESLAVDDITIDGTTISNTNTTTATIITTSNSQNISLEPDTNGTVIVPSGYETRSGFSDDSLVNKKYVDAVATGLDVKEAVRVATTAELTSVTYDNATGTLTGPQEVLSIDGIAIASGDRILVKNQGDTTAANAVQNGIYTLTTVGSGSAAWVLTRAPDADAAAELSGGTFFFVEEGTNLGDAGFVATHNGVPTFGTTEITFEQFSGAGQISAGSALSKTGNTLNVEVDDTTIEVSSDALQLKDLGITNVKISASAAIAQSKLDLLAADADYASALGSFTQSDLGLCTFDSNQFTVTNGWATVTTLDGGTYS